MASGDPVLKIIQAMRPATTAAQQVFMTGGSTPGEQLLAWRFQDTAIQYIDFLVQLRGYAGGGLSFTLLHDTATGTAGNNVRIGLALRRRQAAGTALSTAHSYSYTDATFATPNPRGGKAYGAIALTNGAQMDSLANNEFGILRVRRQPADAADVLAGDWLLLAISALET